VTAFEDYACYFRNKESHTRREKYPTKQYHTALPPGWLGTLNHHCLIGKKGIGTKEEHMKIWKYHNHKPKHHNPSSFT